MFAELAFALWNGLSLVLALQLGLWGVAFYAGLFAVGLAAVASATLKQASQYNYNNARSTPK
ncbi:MAG: hypothetical protein WCL57_04175 [Chloroflexota bacterium]